MVPVEALCRLLPRGSIARLMALEGPVLRSVVDHTAGHRFLRRVSHGGLGRLSAAVARSAGLLEGRDRLELCLFVLRYYFEPFLEDMEADRTCATFFLNRCPYGWAEPRDRLLCDAVMDFERRLCSGIGVTLHIEETLPQGAPRCRFSLHLNPGPGEPPDGRDG